MNEQLTALVRAGDTQTLAGMIARGELANLQGAEKGDLPRLAASLGQTAVLRLLCSRCHGICLDTDARGWNVLHCACAAGHGDTAAFCVEVLGYDPMQGDRAGETALALAAQAEDQSAYAYLTRQLGFMLEDCYSNPVARGFHPDPSVVRVGEDYYMVNSTFTFFPGLPISHSRDLVHWETIGHAAADLAAHGLEGLPGGFGYWAPDISFDGRRFWVVATMRRNTVPFRQQMICWAEKPEGPWSTPKFLPVDGIDPSLFVDDDGTKYLVVNPGGSIARLTETGDLAEEAHLIYAGTLKTKSEGPHLLRKDGWYYLFQAEGGTGPNHTETVARSRCLTGPYEPCPFNPILSRKQEEPYVRRSGHGKPLQLADGRWAMLYLCTRQVEGATLMGRETGLDPMEWTQDGWPMVNHLKGPSCLQRKLLPDVPVSAEIDWVAPRTDPAAFACWEGENLILRGGAELSAMGGVSLLARRQEEAAFIQQAEVDVENLTGKAGLAGYYDENSWYMLALEQTEESCRLVALEHAGTETRELASIPWQGNSAKLRVRASGLARVLEYEKTGVWHEFTRVHAKYLTDEGLRMGKRFTGAVLGMAAVGQGSAVFRGRKETMMEEKSYE